MSVRKIFAYCLFPLTIWYSVVVSIRNFLFDLGLLRQVSPEITTIGIGNLSTGGTGKTPHVEYLINLLSGDYEIAMVSRGYKRRSKGMQIDDGTHSPDLLGDEAAMVAKKYPAVRVGVSKKRIDAIHAIGHEHPQTNLVILDDIMQHRSLRPTLTILLTDYNHPYFDDYILPFGNLRESRRGSLRANIIIVTKSPEKLDPITRHNITQSLRTRTYQKVFFSHMRYGSPQPLFDNPQHPLSHFKNILCLTGIANGTPLADHLRSTVNHVEHLAFADHHDYRPRDIEQIIARYNNLPDDAPRAIITTEKDAARLQQPELAELLQDIPIYALPIEVVFHDEHNYTFDNEITQLVKENVFYQNRLSLTRN